MIETQFTELLNLLDFKLAALIFLSSYWVKSNFKDIAPKINLSIKIFIWSTLISIVYYTISKTSGLYQTGEWYNIVNHLLYSNFVLRACI